MVASAPAGWGDGEGMGLARDVVMPAALPAGTVTLLLSDVEGSTRLLLHLGDRYLDALREHRRLLREAVAARGGAVVDSRGDELFAAFESAEEAVLAAVDAQRALAAYPWPEGGTIRVRMGLHTGAPSRTPDGYAGLDVHRVARLGSAGHGGQVLLSEATRDLIADTLPEGLGVRDLGEHRLRDIPRPERVFQLVVPGLPDEFPPLRSLGATGGLPSSRRVLIGRDRELAEARELLRGDRARLVTLTGPGGSGKTVLALHVAASLAAEFPDGAYFVPLSPVARPDDVAGAIARELRVREVRGEEPTATLVGALRGRRSLLVLDNFEHLIGAAGLVAELLQASAGVRVLVTSREVLRIAEETALPLPPLAAPGGEPSVVGDAELERLARLPAVQLFVERATEVRPEFALGPDNAPAVAEVCRRLDGLPLAIELAASRVRLLPPAALLARLQRRLPLLTGGPRDLPARQQTLRDTIAWSYDLLTDDERRLFAALAIFAGGCTLEAAEHVAEPVLAGGPVAPDVPCLGADPFAARGASALDVLASLLDKSMLQQEVLDDGEPRLRMLETIREFALERLAATPDAAMLGRRHAEYYAGLAEEAAARRRGGDQDAALARLERDLDNLRAALAWAERNGDAELGARLCAALWPLWSVRGFLAEGRRWLDQLLRRPGEPTPARAEALFGAGRIAWEQGDYAAATEPLTESLRVARALGDERAVAAALTQLGHVARSQGDHQAARARYAESLQIRREIGDRAGIAQTVGSLGNLALLRGDLAAAHVLYEECLTLMREVGDRRDVMNALHKLGEIAHEEGDAETARARFRESLGIARERGDRRGIAYALEGFAGLAALEGRPERALRLAGAASALRQAIGAPAEPGTRARVEGRLEPAVSTLGEVAATAARRAGAALPLDQALGEALA
jgi:predicted ATPase/class 3 adenylate cyclase